VFTLGLSIATGLIVGVLPAWQLARQNVIDTLREVGRTQAGGRRRLRWALVVAEIALASLLLVGAGLTLRSFQALVGTDGGFETKGRLTAFISLPSARYSTDAVRVAAYDRIEARLAALPGVRAVGGTSHLPVSGEDSRTSIAIEGREATPEAPTRAHPRAVTLNYFGTLGIRLVQGRHFSAADHDNAPLVAIVNETMATRYWPDGSAVGRRVRLGAGRAWREIVGIVADVRHWGFHRPANPEIYLPQKQMVWDGLTFVLAAEIDPAALTPAVRAALAEVDPDLPLSSVQTLDAVAARSVETRRSTVLLLGLFSALALILAAAGIYAVMAQLVALRTPEIGVRLALGARPAAVMRLVLGEALGQAAAGLACGLTAGVLVMRVFESSLFQVRPADPLTLAMVAVLLAGTALAACMVPAWRAMRTNPARVLRT
jgi:putative ABC transport system permease protein